MCNPVSLIVGALGGMAVSKAMAPKQQAAAPAQAASDPAAERAAAEAQAQQTANRKLAEDQRRRREQQSLLAKGAPQPSLGDATAGADAMNPMGATTRSSVARAGSLIARGAATGATTAGIGPSMSMGGGNSRQQVMAL